MFTAEGKNYPLPKGEEFMSKENRYTITISMEDEDIGCEFATVTIRVEGKCKDTLNDIKSKINDAFNDYESWEEGSEDFRADGWGICTFIDYLKYRFPDWNIEDVNPDLTVSLSS